MLLNFHLQLVFLNIVSNAEFLDLFLTHSYFAAFNLINSLVQSRQTRSELPCEIDRAKWIIHESDWYLGFAWIVSWCSAKICTTVEILCENRRTAHIQANTSATKPSNAIIENLFSLTFNMDTISATKVDFNSSKTTKATNMTTICRTIVYLYSWFP